MLCQGGQLDTRPYTHILWNDASDLRDRLVTRIRALLQAPKPWGAQAMVVAVSVRKSTEQNGVGACI